MKWIVICIGHLRETRKQLEHSPAEDNPAVQPQESQQLVDENKTLKEELQRARADSVTATPRSQGSFTTVHVPGE